MPLPPLLNAENVDVKISMVTQSSIFTFREKDSIVFLNQENKIRFFKGQLCPDNNYIVLEFQIEDQESKKIVT